MDQPNNDGGKEHWGWMDWNGYWGDTGDTDTSSYFVCELT